MHQSHRPGTKAGSERVQSTPHTVPDGPQQYLPLLGQVLMQQRSATPEDRQLAAIDQPDVTEKAVASLLQRLAAAAQHPQQQVQEQERQHAVEAVQLRTPAVGEVASLPCLAASTAGRAAAAAGTSSTTEAESQPVHQQLQPPQEQQQRAVPTYPGQPVGPALKRQQEQQALRAKLRMKPGKHLAAAAAHEARQTGAAAASITQWRGKPLNLSAAKTTGRPSGLVPSPRIDAPSRVPATPPQPQQQQQQQQGATPGPTWPDPAAAAAAAAADVAVPGQTTPSPHIFAGVRASHTTESPSPMLSPPSTTSSAHRAQVAGVQRVAYLDSVDSYVGMQPSGRQAAAAAAAGGSGAVPACQIRSDLIRSVSDIHTNQQIRDVACCRPGQPLAAAPAVQMEPASPGLLQLRVTATPTAAAASGEAGSDLSGLELLVDAAAAAVSAPEASAPPQQQQQPQHMQGQHQQLLHLKELQHQVQQLQAEFWQQQQQQQQQHGPAAAIATVDLSLDHHQQQQQSWNLEERHQRLLHIQQRLEALRAQVQHPAAAAAAAAAHQPRVQQQQQQGVSPARAGIECLPISSNLGDWLSQLTTLLHSGLNIQHLGLPQHTHTTAAAAAAAGEQGQQQQQQHHGAWQGIYQPAEWQQGLNTLTSQNPPDMAGGFALPVNKPTLQPPTLMYLYTNLNPSSDLVTKLDMLNPSSSRALNPTTSNPSNRLTSNAEKSQQLQQLLAQLRQLDSLQSDLDLQPPVVQNDLDVAAPVVHAEAVLSQPAPLDMCAFRSVLAGILDTNQEAKALLQQAANLGLITRSSQQQAAVAAAAGNCDPYLQQTSSQQQRQQGMLLAPSGGQPAAAAAASELRGADTTGDDQLSQTHAAKPPLPPAAAAAAAAVLVTSAADKQQCVAATDGEAHSPPLKRRPTDDLTTEQEWLPAAAAAAAAEGQSDADLVGGHLSQRASKRHRTDLEAQNPSTPAAAAAAAAAEEEGEQSATVPAKVSPVTADSQAAAKAAAADSIITAEPNPRDQQIELKPGSHDHRQQQQQQQDCSECLQEQEGQLPQQQHQQGDRVNLCGAPRVQQADQPQEEQITGLHQQQQHQHDEAAADAPVGRVTHHLAATSAVAARAAAAAASEHSAGVAAAGPQQPQTPALASDNTLEPLPAAAAAAAAAAPAPAVDWEASAELLGRIAAVLSRMQRHMHGLAFLAIPCAADLLLVRRTVADLIRQIAADLETPPTAAAAAEGAVASDAAQQGDRQTTSSLNVLKLHVSSLQQQAAADRATVADQQQQISDLQQQLAAAQQQQRQQARLVAAAVTQMMGVLNSTAGLSDQDRMNLITVGAELLQSML